VSAQSNIERHIISHMNTLLNDEHALRRFSGLQDAGQLTSLFHAAPLRHLELAHPSTRDDTARSLIGSIAIGRGSMRVAINLPALGSTAEMLIELPLLDRKPFREAKLRIDNTGATDHIDRKLVSLIAEAIEVRELVLASPELSLNQLGKREGRCRTQLGKLFRLSWLSPRIIEAIIDGRQPARIDRRVLLEADLPLCWQAQERMLGFAG
jgi:site-specific DNA recombinase